MFKFSHLILFVTVGWCAFLLFWTSQSVYNKEKVLKDLQRTSLQEQEYIRVLNSEWDYLNRPERLETLAHQYFTNKNFKSDAEVVLTSMDVLKTPLMPSVPMRKPQEKFHFVSSGQVKAVKSDVAISPVISKPEQQRFNDLVGQLSDDGGVHD